jgi:hypothetical protein
MTYEIEDESIIPAELLCAVESGKTIQIESCIGWLDLDNPEFRCMNVYRVKPDEPA